MGFPEKRFSFIRAQCDCDAVCRKVTQLRKYFPRVGRVRQVRRVRRANHGLSGVAVRTGGVVGR